MIRGMIRVAALVALMTGASASAQERVDKSPAGIAEAAAKANAPFWTFANGRLHHVPSGLSFPSSIGPFLLRELTTSRPGTGLDDVLQYSAPGIGSFISLFVFRPTLPDTGLTAAMTDHLIHGRFGREVKPQAMDHAIGGTAATMHVVGYADGVLRGSPFWTGAGFVRAGPWLAVLRISGPAEQRQAIEQAINHLAGSMGVAASASVPPFHRIETEGCRIKDGKKAVSVPLDAGDAAAYALVIAGEATDGASGQTLDGTRVPARFCVSRLGPDPLQSPLLLRPQGDTTGSLPLSDIAALLLLDDAGGLLEVSRPAAKPGAPYFIIRHGLGKAEILGAFDRAPTLKQYEDMLSGKLAVKAGGQVSYTVDAFGKIEVLVPPEPGAGKAAKSK